MSEMIGALADKFLKFQQTRGLSANTLYAYRQGLKQFAEHGPDITRDAIKAFVSHMQAKRMRPATIALRLSGTRQMLRWAEDERLLPDAARLAGYCRSLLPRRKTQEPLGVPTIGQFLEMRAQEGAEGFGLVLEALAGTGLRLRALLSLKPTHLRLNGHKPHILVDAGSMACKGAYAGIVPITPYVAKLLSGQTQSPIFQCSASYVQKKLPALGAQHGIPQLHAHALRHLYCAMIYYKDFDGGRFNPVAVRDAAGHASIAVTDRYLKLARTLVSSDSEWNLWANGGTKP